MLDITRGLLRLVTSDSAHDRVLLALKSVANAMQMSTQQGSQLYQPMKDLPFDVSLGFGSSDLCLSLVVLLLTGSGPRRRFSRTTDCRVGGLNGITNKGLARTDKRVKLKVKSQLTWGGWA